jgi:hypothetical protein
MLMLHVFQALWFIYCVIITKLTRVFSTFLLFTKLLITRLVKGYCIH